jgi:protein-L-isoaspartate O-methyltransferase
MVLPVGPPGTTQELLLLRNSADGHVETRRVLPVTFVPLVHETHG